MKFYELALSGATSELKPTRAIWNQLLTLGLQAHRLGDKEFRDKFIANSVNSKSGLFRDTDIERELTVRFSKLDHMYLFHLLMLQTIALEDRRFKIPGLANERFQHITSEQGAISNDAARVALDTLGKRSGRQLNPEFAIRDYAVSSRAFETYVLNVPMKSKGS